MRSGDARDEVTPASGLVVPIVTILDAEARLIESDQRAVVQHVLQAGRGAGSVFVMGTTGEWNHVDASTRREAIAVSVDAVASENAKRSEAPYAQAWVGVTAPDVDETLACVELSASVGADAIVLAPLAISDLSDPEGFVCDEIAPRLRARGGMPLYLYDNAEIAASPEKPLLDPEALRRLGALECVRGIKISASRDAVETAIRELGASQHERAALDVYVGHASMIFGIARDGGPLMAGVADPAHHVRLAGLVPGAANANPRAWRLAWEACCRGDTDLIDLAERVVDEFRKLTFVAARRPVIAAIKRALLVDGIVSSAAVAPGTEALDGHEARAFDASYRARAVERARALDVLTSRMTSGD